MQGLLAAVVSAGASGGPAWELQRFAKRLSADYDAVCAGMALDWSNGPVEGQIDWLETLKRKTHSRANSDLLERMFLVAS